MTESPVDGVPLVPDQTAENLNERQRLAYREHRRHLISWMNDLGKIPEKAVGYAQSVVRTRTYRLDSFYRWVWDREGFTTEITTDHADGWMRVNPEGVETDLEVDTVPGINVLEPHNADELSQGQREKQVDMIVSDPISLFRRQSENWGDRFGRNLAVLLQAYIELNIDRDESNTLVDVYDCVTGVTGNEDNGAFSGLIDRMDDHILRKQLRRARDEIKQHGSGPIERRFSDFTGSKTIRNVIAAKDSAVDFKQVVDNGEIVLVDIQKGSLSSTAVELIGSIMITQIWAAAQSRIRQPMEDRELFTLYVDELHNFAGEGSNIAKILAEAAEYRLGCWLVTQYLKQLDSDLRSAAMTSCRTKIVFEPNDSQDFARLYVIQEIGLFDHMTVGENVATVPELRGWDQERIDERVDELLGLMGLPSKEYRDQYPTALSGGQQQRVGVARSRGRPGRDAHGRAVRRARPDNTRGATRRVPQHPATDRYDDPVRHPRYRRSIEDGRENRPLQRR